MTPDTIRIAREGYNETASTKGGIEMSSTDWQTIKVCYCHHVGKDVGLEAQVVFPSDVLPDQPPRVLGHRCSDAFACNLDGRASCMWAGTNPAFDPFLE
jgi:hypothetical protein